MRLRRKTIRWIIPLFLLAMLIVLCQFIYWGKRTGCPANEMCSLISRKYYPVRHWQWSGIFPVEGGFIPDPHFSYSEPMLFPDSVNRMLGSSGSRFQIVEVNSDFNDDSSEILFLVGSRGRLFEYSLTFPKQQGVRAVISYPSEPDARVFPYRDKIAILTDFFGPAKGIYLLQPPLKSGVKLHLIPVRSSEFEDITKEFKLIAPDETVKQQFCETLPFASFYEKYATSCGWTTEDYANNPSVYDFNAFWLKD